MKLSGQTESRPSAGLVCLWPHILCVIHGRDEHPSGAAPPGTPQAGASFRRLGEIEEQNFRLIVGHNG